MTRLISMLAALVLALPVFAADVAPIGDDGLHKAPWMRDTFLDLGEDLEEATAEGLRFMIIFEQRGCIYCKKMHEEVFVRDNVTQMIEDNFFVVQLNLHGSRDVVDFDGEELSERALARKWGLLFTPTILFMPEQVDGAVPGPQAAVAMMPGAFGAGTVFDMLTWVVEKRYDLDGEEDFQRYHARRIMERQAGTAQ